MLNGQNKFLLCSSAALCVIAGAVSAPAVSFAQSDPDAAAPLTAPLNNLKDVQQSYAPVKGGVSDMPAYGLPLRAKAGKALEQLQSDVIGLKNSNKVPNELVQGALSTISEARTALTTDSAQTIAWSLQTVAQEVQAIQARLTGQNTAQNAPQGGAQTAQANPQEQPKAAAQQPQPPVTATPAKTEAAANQPHPQAQQPQPVADLKHEAEAKPNPQQQPQPNQPAPAQPSASTTGAIPPSTSPSTAVNMKRDDLIGKRLYDSAGDEVATIQDVKMSPDGKIQAVEVDVGGFLGIGSKRVAVPADQVQVRGDHITATSMTSSQIHNLPRQD